MNNGLPSALHNSPHPGSSRRLPEYLLPFYSFFLSYPPHPSFLCEYDEIEHRFDPEVSDLEQLKRLLKFSRRFISALRISQFPSHLDLGLLFDSIGPSLRGLTLTYGMRNVAMDYDRSLFGMKLPDIRALSKNLGGAEALVHLSLTANSIDDEKVKILTQGLLDNLTVTHLDLSQNKISDRGARALAKVRENSEGLA
jgi:hypothetical protein